MSGKCQIKITASGKYAREHDIRLRVSPDELRRLALFTIENCVEAKQIGGYATKDIENVESWVVSPETNFPRSLDLPPSITFFTAMVWHVEGAGMEKDYDPGVYDPWTTRSIMELVIEAEAEYWPQSALWRVLDVRREYLLISAEVQEIGREIKRAWWESWIYPPNLHIGELRNTTSGCISNKTLALPGKEEANCSISDSKADS